MVRKTPIATGSSSQCPGHLAPHPYPGNWRLPVLRPSVRSSTTSDLRNPGPLRLLLFSTESARVHLPQTDTQTPQTHHLLLLDNFPLCFKSQAFSFFRGVCAVGLHCPPPLVRPSLLFCVSPMGQVWSSHHNSLLPTMWVPRMVPRSSGLAAGALAHRAISALLRHLPELIISLR